MPLPYSSVDEKEDAFVITFDDSESDSENQPDPVSPYPSRITQKKFGGVSGIGSASVLLHSTSVIPSQSPSDLKMEIDRMKEQIAAMERTKGKTPTPAVLGKSTKFLVAEAARHGVPSATGTKSGFHMGTTNMPTAAVDLESMRLRIAAKESELQQRRQRPTVKGAESGKVVNDLRGTGGALASSLPPVVRSTQTRESSAAPPVNTEAKAASERTTPEVGEAVQVRCDGIQAPALVGATGRNMAGFEKSAGQEGVGGYGDHGNLKDVVPDVATLQVASDAREVAGQQALTRGTKRLSPEGERWEVFKVPRYDNGSHLEKSPAGDFVASVPGNMTSKGNISNMPSVQSQTLTQPAAEVRPEVGAANCTIVASTEQQPKMLGSSNLNNSLSAETNRVQTTLSRRPLSVHAPTMLEHQVGRSVQPGQRRVFDPQLHAERDGFQQLMEEEELLDKRLEEAQQIRQQCENRERVARREYREAQRALRTANADCDTLNQRKEFLLSQIHAAEARRYSVNLSLDRQSLPFQGTLATNAQNKDEYPLYRVSAPNHLRVNQAADRSWEYANGDHDHSGQAHESVSPLSSNRGDIADVVCRNVQSALSTEVVEDYPSSISAERAPLDGKEHELSLQMISQVECSGLMEDSCVVREKRIQTTSVDIEIQEGVEAGTIVEFTPEAEVRGPREKKIQTTSVGSECGTIVDIAAQVESKRSVSCSGHLNNHGVRRPSSADLERVSLDIPNFASEGQNTAGSSRYDRGMSANDLENSEQVSRIQISKQSEKFPSVDPGCCGDSSAGAQFAVHTGNTGHTSKQCEEFSSVDHSCCGGSWVGAQCAVHTENDGHTVYTWSDTATVVDSTQLTHRVLEQNHLEKLTSLTTSQDGQTVDSRDTEQRKPSPAEGLDGIDAQCPANLREANMVLGSSIQGESLPNVSRVNCEDPTPLRCLKEDNAGVAIHNSFNRDYRRLREADSEELSTSRLKVSVDKMIVPDRPSLPQHKDEVPKDPGALEGDDFQPQDKSVTPDAIQFDLPTGSIRREGTENGPVERSAGGPGGGLSSNEPQLSIHDCENGADMSSDLFSGSKNTPQVAVSQMENEAPTVSPDSLTKIATHLHQPEEALLLDKGADNRVFQLIQASNVNDAVAIVENQRRKEGEIPGEQLEEFLIGADQRNYLLAPDPSSDLLQEGLETHVLQEEHQGLSVAESKESVSVESLREHGEIRDQGLEPDEMALAEDKEQQQGPLSIELSESGKLMCQDPGKKEIKKAAEVEDFRKALLDGDVFERRSSIGEIVDMTSARRLDRQVSEKILPQLQHHRLEHLLDMVEVRRSEFSVGGETLVQEELQSSANVPKPLVVDVVQPDTSTLNHSEKRVCQSTEQAQVADAQEAAHVNSTPVEDNGHLFGRWVPSAVPLAVLSCIPRVVVQHSDDDSLHNKELKDHESVRQMSFGASVLTRGYESPLSVFRSHRICPQISDSLQVFPSSSTWSHAINPFKPLCKFEHRGKCNNGECPWQHEDDYTLSPSQLMSQRLMHSDSHGLNCDDHASTVTALDNGTDPAKAAIFSPTLGSFVTDLMAGLHLEDCAAILAKSSLLQSSSSPKWKDCEAVVPIYHTGSYTLKVDCATNMSVLPHGHLRARKVDSSQSFFLSPSIHRPLPSDIPCLLDASGHICLLSENSGYGTEIQHWRYMEDMQKKVVFTEDGATQELVDEEMWLELALHHIDFDISSNNHQARDKALFYLSRALESKPSSVALWAAYSCLFHTRKDTPETDDMFSHAVQYNKGSYELWLLYVNSRPDLPSRLKAYEKALVDLSDGGTKVELSKEELSAFLLDIGLQMLYCMSVSEHTQDFFLWVDDLIHSASIQDELKPHRASTRALLSYLTIHDSCVLWIACAYFSACMQLPTSMISRFGCKQELPSALDWETCAKADEVSRRGVFKVLSAAASGGRGCLALEFPQPETENKDHYAVQVLGVNYVQCLAFYEGLDSAEHFGHKLMHLYPHSLELSIICARIAEHRKGPNAGLQVFEEAVLQWPSGSSGIQSLWNQYFGHALLWCGKDFARSILMKCMATADQKHVLPAQPSELRGSVSLVCNREGITHGVQLVESWSDIREYFVDVATVMCKRIDSRTVTDHESFQVEDSMFALINLALVEALSGDMSASYSAINKAVKAAVSHKESIHCWRELAALQRASFSKSSGLEDMKMLQQRILVLLDRCKTDSHISSHMIPLSQKALENFKKPHVRRFFEDLVGLRPLDHSALNAILHTFYGPQLLPSGSDALKEVFSFAEGILEAMPGNVPLASCLCKLVVSHNKTLKRMYLSVAVWAVALLVSSLTQSCPVAPEVYWVQAGLLLRQFDEERSLKEFFANALVKYPFSAALKNGLQVLQSGLHSLAITNSTS